MIKEVAQVTKRLVSGRVAPLTIAAALVVGGLAIAFSQITGRPTNAVLFSGQDAFAELFKDAPTLSVSTLAYLLLFKGLAWSISLGNFRAARHSRRCSSARWQA